MKTLFLINVIVLLRSGMSALLDSQSGTEQQCQWVASADQCHCAQCTPHHYHSTGYYHPSSSKTLHWHCCLVWSLHSLCHSVAAHLISWAGLLGWNSAVPCHGLLDDYMFCRMILYNDDDQLYAGHTDCQHSSPAPLSSRVMLHGVMCQEPTLHSTRHR